MSSLEAPDPWVELWFEDAAVLLDRQTKVLELIAGAASLHDVLAEILVSLEHLMDGARCSVLLLDREHGTLHHGAAPSLPPEYVGSVDGMAIGEGAGSCGTAAALNASVVAADVRTDPRWTDFRAAADAAGLRSCWSSPIQGRDGLPIGTFAVYHPWPHHPTQREQLLVDRFTHLAAVAIEHAGLLGDLVESERRFRTSFDDNSLGMALLGLDRTVVTSNNALTTLVGATSSLAGRALAALLVPCDRTLEAWLDDLDRVGPAPVVFEAVLLRDAGPDVGVEVTASLLAGRDGLASQYVVNVFDLTERRAAERDRRARLQAETARRTAEELAHARSELLAAVGHEARTPIQAIVGFAELLRTIDLDETRRGEALNHIEAAAGHVIDLLTDVLDLSRVEANALPLALEPVRLHHVVEEVFGLLSAKAEQRRVALSHSLAQEVVLADRRRLRQVLLNLVSNSIRHGRVGGEVVVRPRAAAVGNDLLVSVDDDGPGIPAELLPRIFTPFSRALAPSPGDRSSAAADPGVEESVGLGLGLAHGLMSAMSGELSVAQSGSSGSSMLLRIPRADDPPAHTHELRATPAPGTPERNHR